MGIGAFSNVTVPTSGFYGGDFSRLRATYDPNYASYQVWQSPRTLWVWESGVEYGSQPINYSGVTVNGVFSTPSGPIPHTVDYTQGRIIFTSGISSNATVRANYSYRWVNVKNADSAWFSHVLYDSLRVDTTQFQIANSGSWSIIGNSRMQLPAVLVEVVPRTTHKGLQLGGGQWVYQDVLFHIFAQNKWESDNLSDILDFQNFKSILLLDRNKMASSGVFPININGRLSANPKTYPQLLQDYEWKRLRFTDTHKEEVGDISLLSPRLYCSKVKTTIEIAIPNI